MKAVSITEFMNVNDRLSTPNKKRLSLITAGSTYLDIDAYACMVAMAELLRLQGENAFACSCAPCNYSVSPLLLKDGQAVNDLAELPDGLDDSRARYIIVDVSDPEYIKNSVPLECISEVYDHHVGFEDYWSERIGEGTRIEFLGAAATLIYREWKKAEACEKMSIRTARLLVAAILDNTLYLTSKNTTEEDVSAFEELCKIADVDADWCGRYFAEVQTSIEADLRNALLGDVKAIRDNVILPARVGQLCVWNAERILLRIGEIRAWFNEAFGSWMINLIDIEHKCSYFLCDDQEYQKKIGCVFDVDFNEGVARTHNAYLRKEIIKKTLNN